MFKLFCVYRGKKVLVEDYAKDFKRNLGATGLLFLILEVSDKRRVIFNAKSGVLLDYCRSYSNLLNFCVNIEGYIYSLGSELEFEVKDVIPVNTAQITSEETNKIVDKHVEIVFEITGIMNKGSSDFKKLDKKIKVSKFLKFDNSGENILNIM